MLLADYQKHTLRFKFEAGTSRGILTTRDTYFLRLRHTTIPGPAGIGECAPLPGLSPEADPGFEAKLQAVVAHINTGTFGQTETEVLAGIGMGLPSVRFGLETAWRDLNTGGTGRLFDTPFGRGGAGIPINGLVWMGTEAFMREQIDAKLEAGFRCLKLKIGAIDFDRECGLLAYIRQHYSSKQVTLRVDANGAFSPEEAPEKLRRLAEFQLHSIEQPIRAGQSAHMAQLCDTSPVPVALDEELIGVTGREARQRLLATLQPAYLVLKPSLLGGWRACEEWIELAEEHGMKWWITSALESNIGLNAIAQFMATYDNPLPQGLGTGQLYHNNIAAPLEIRRGFLHFDPKGEFRLQDTGFERRVQDTDMPN